MGVNNHDDKAIRNAKEERFERLLSKLDEIERQLSQKADDIVSFQVLHHRNELEELETRLSYIEMKLDILSQTDESEIEVVKSTNLKKKPLMNKIASIFTL